MVLCYSGPSKLIQCPKGSHHTYVGHVELGAHTSMDTDKQGYVQKEDDKDEIGIKKMH